MSQAYKNLFGEVCEPPVKKLGRRSNGYAARPGSGPVGETCKGCEHYCYANNMTAKKYRKCALMRASWTHGPGTDIKAKSPACRHWQQQSKE